METKSDKILPCDLAFDVDGVFADSFRLFAETVKNDYGISIEYEAITEYEFWKAMNIDEGICQEIVRKILDFPLEIGIQPINGAVEVLTRLLGVGPLLFVTARPDGNAILKWIQMNLGLADTDCICVESTGAADEKLPVLLKHGVKYFVEDRLETCYILDQTPVTPIVFEQPWNKRPHPFKTVRSWDEISAMIEWFMD
ncbi:MAG: haloacid dehalogenase [Thermodesulfobacteriota bacterium]|nr:haloacid dehalogenase [Thermodesulfobacteriota bacterium]